MDSSPRDVTELLIELRVGNRDAEAKLIPLVYDELRRLAAHYMRQERPDHTLQPTGLVNEAYLRLGEKGGEKRVSGEKGVSSPGLAVLHSFLRDARTDVLWRGRGWGQGAKARGARRPAPGRSRSGTRAQLQRARRDLAPIPGSCGR